MMAGKIRSTSHFAPRSSPYEVSERNEEEQNGAEKQKEKPRLKLIIPGAFTELHSAFGYEKKEKLPASHQLVAGEKLIVDEVDDEEEKWESPVFCPLHSDYVMEERKIDTGRGPSTLHSCSSDDCCVACFGDKEAMTQCVSKVQENLHWRYREKHCPLVCYCNFGMNLHVSESDNNPGRLYLCCHYGDCKAFQWADMTPKWQLKKHWKEYMKA